MKTPARTPLEIAAMLLIAKAERRGVYKYLALLATKKKQPKLARKMWCSYYADNKEIGEMLRALNKFTEGKKP